MNQFTVDASSQSIGFRVYFQVCCVNIIVPRIIRRAVTIADRRSTFASARSTLRPVIALNWYAI
jgi:hypothetical protein